MATNSSILAWEILWTEEPGRHSPWGCKDWDMTEHTLLSLSRVRIPSLNSDFPIDSLYVPSQINEPGILNLLIC